MVVLLFFFYFLFFIFFPLPSFIEFLFPVSPFPPRFLFPFFWFRWSSDRCDAVVDPLMERLSELQTQGKITQKTLLEFFSVGAAVPPSQPAESRRLNSALAKVVGVTARAVTA